MLDPKLLRENPKHLAERLATRGFSLDVAHFEILERERRQLQIKTQDLQNKRNLSSKTIGEAKAKNQDVKTLLIEVNTLNEELKITEEQLTTIQNQLHDLYLQIPNLPHPTVPLGTSEKENVTIRSIGTVPSFSFTPQDHVALGSKNNAMNFDLASKITGARFVVLQGQLARLQRALIQFMLDIHTKEHGYQEIYTPYIVHRDSLLGTGQLPKFEEDQFALKGEQPYYLLPTAEVSVTNVLRNEIIDAKKLPLKYVCHSPCFRSEAGSYGKDARGMIRQHQFEKVELVQFCLPESSYELHEALTQHAEIILQRLALPYRVVALCTADLGFSAAKTYDLEVWLPSQNCYREISSCSNFEAFQARRMQARFRQGTHKPELLHTLNGSALAVGRTLVAIMENFQDADGRIHLPSALWPYMEGIKIIT